MRYETKVPKFQFPHFELIVYRPQSIAYGLSSIVPPILIFLIFLSFSNTALCTTEHERQGMSQRAHKELEQILNTKEFSGQDLEPSWLSRWLENLLGRLPGGTRWLGVLLEWLFYLAAVIAIISLCVFIAMRLRRFPSIKTGRYTPVESGDNDPETAKAKAHEYFQSGEYRQAIRHLYLSLLLNLDRAGLVTYDVAKTNGEYESEVRASMSGKAESFHLLTRFFERKWYGMEESNAMDFQQCEETFAELTTPEPID